MTTAQNHFPFFGGFDPLLFSDLGSQCWAGTRMGLVMQSHSHGMQGGQGGHRVSLIPLGSPMPRARAIATHFNEGKYSPEIKLSRPPCILQKLLFTPRHLFFCLLYSFAAAPSSVWIIAVNFAIFAWYSLLDFLSSFSFSLATKLLSFLSSLNAPFLSRLCSAFSFDSCTRSLSGSYERLSALYDSSNFGIYVLIARGR